MLNQHKFSYEQIRQGTYPRPDLSDFEKSTLDFCTQWLNNAPTFTIHTSGSTGAPKPILIQRSQMQASAHATARALGLRSGQSALVCLNTAYIGGMMMLVRGFALGLSLHIISPQANPLAMLLSHETQLTPGKLPRFDFSAMVPLQLQTMLEESPAAEDFLNQLRC